MNDEVNKSLDRNVFRIIDLKSNETDFAYWQTQSVEKRLEALETLRTQYIIWKYDTEQGFQRVYRIIERT